METSSRLPLLAERDGDILTLTLNRPERHNALNAELHHLLGSAVRGAKPAGVKVIVLTGAGPKAFCSGGDMREMSGAEGPVTTLPPPSERLNGTIEITATPLPVIAAINGYCYGGGARLAIACDIRLAADSAMFRLPGVEYGLAVATTTLPRLVGVSRAKEWIFTARAFDAREALASNLVSATYPREALLAAAQDMARVIAGHSADAVQECKRLMDAVTLPERAHQLEEEANGRLRGSDEQSARFRDATRRVTGRQGQ